MRRTPRLSIHACAATFAVFAAAVPLAVMLPVLASATREAADARAVEALRSTAQQSATLLARAVHVPWRELDGLAAFAREEGLGSVRFRIRLETAKALNDRLSWLGVAGPDGRVLLAANGTLEGQDIGSRAWFRAGLEAPFAGDVREAVLLQRALAPHGAAEPLRILDFAAPVRRASDGAVVGVIGVNIGWNWVRDLVREAARPAGSDVLLVSRDGTVVVGPPGLEGTRQHHLRAVLAAGHGASVTAEEAWPDGGRYVSASSPVPGYDNMPSFGWSVVVRQPSHLAFAPARAAARRLLPPLLGVSLLLLAAGLAFARAIGRPVAALAASAEAMAAGRLDEPVPDQRGSREAATLSAALARLQSALTRRAGSGEDTPRAAARDGDPGGTREAMPALALVLGARR